MQKEVIMKRILAFAFLPILVFGFCISAFSQASSQSWYCKRNTDNKQPIFGAELSYVEQYGGYFIDKRHGDTDAERIVYLTFDAGYENGNVSRILDTLKEKDVKGAFFILSHLVVKNTELVKRMADEGHLVCNHTATHPDMTTKRTFEEFSSELYSLENVYKEYTGRELSKYFRPPEGRFNADVLKYAQQMGYKTVFWSFAYEDWNNGSQMSPELAKTKILENIHNGAVILLHPTSETNADILGEVIEELKAQGYSFGTLDELTRE